MRISTHLTILNTMTIRSTVTKISAFVLLIIIIIASIFIYQNCQNSIDPEIDQLFSVEEIPRFDIKSKSSITYYGKYYDADFSLKDEDFSGKIKTRGNTSQSLAEKYDAPFAYRIKLAKKKSLLGLDAGKTYILLPHFVDTSIRQFYHLNLAHYLLKDSSWSSHAKFVEVYLNDEYAGLYVLAEAISESEARINYKNDLGFIVEMDLQGKAPLSTETYIKNDTFSIDYKVDTIRYDNDKAIKQPANVAFLLTDPDEFGETTEEHQKYIIQTLENLYKDIAAQKPIDELNIDLDSFVYYFLMHEIAGDYGSGSNSVYYWNDGKKTHAGPFWDTDFLTHNYITTESMLNIDTYTKNPLYVNLFKNPEYKAKYIEAYTNFYNNTAPNLKKALLKLKDNKVLKAAWEKNMERYQRLSGKYDGLYFTQNENIESRKTFEEQIDYIIGFYFDGFTGKTFWEDQPEEKYFEPRLKWLNEHIREW